MLRRHVGEQDARGAADRRRAQLAAGRRARRSRARAAAAARARASYASASSKLRNDASAGVEGRDVVDDEQLEGLDQRARPRARRARLRAARRRPRARPPGTPARCGRRRRAAAGRSSASGTYRRRRAERAEQRARAPRGGPAGRRRRTPRPPRRAGPRRPVRTPSPASGPRPGSGSRTTCTQSGQRRQLLIRARRRRSRAARRSARAGRRRGARASSRATRGSPCRAPCAASARPPAGFLRHLPCAGYCRRMSATDLPGGAARRDDMGVSHAADGSAALAPESPARSERVLVQSARRGDPGAIEELYRRHWQRAYRAAYLVARDAHAAEDIAQEAFLQAIRVLDRFDRARPFAPWLHRIVTNRALDWARAHALRRPAVARARGRRARDAQRPLGRSRRGDRPAGAPTSAPSSYCATCSSTRRARSPACSTCRAAPSTRACAARSTSSPARWRREDARAAAGRAPGRPSRRRARARRASAGAGSCSRPSPSAHPCGIGACGLPRLSWPLLAALLTALAAGRGRRREPPARGRLAAPGARAVHAGEADRRRRARARARRVAYSVAARGRVRALGPASDGDLSPARHERGARLGEQPRRRPRRRRPDALARARARPRLAAALVGRAHRAALLPHRLPLRPRPLRRRRGQQGRPSGRAARARRRARLAAGRDAPRARLRRAGRRADRLCRSQQRTRPPEDAQPRAAAELEAGRPVARALRRGGRHALRHPGEARAAARGGARRHGHRRRLRPRGQPPRRRCAATATGA